jgi:NAD-dependent SIR2 family protein deacetylase
MHETVEDALHLAARAISNADALLIGAGAGMGVDSGLPAFRGSSGFWNAYPPYEKLGLGFRSLANPRLFRADPQLAWGFYGHRLRLYRDAVPHFGFEILRQWGRVLPLGCFVFTSNVDGQFQKAHFERGRIVEVHGAIHRFQCLENCGGGLISAETFSVKVDEESMRAIAPLPRCPNCHGMLRPNILMFEDRDWDSSATKEQDARLNSWMDSVAGRRLVIIELGAGTDIPTVRWTCEELMERSGGTLIRINPRQFDVPPGHVSLPLGALDGLHKIQRLLRSVS